MVQSNLAGVCNGQIQDPIIRPPILRIFVTESRGLCQVSPEIKREIDDLFGGDQLRSTRGSVKGGEEEVGVIEKAVCVVGNLVDR